MIMSPIYCADANDCPLPPLVAVRTAVDRWPHRPVLALLRHTVPTSNVWGQKPHSGTGAGRGIRVSGQRVICGSESRSPALLTPPPANESVKNSGSEGENPFTINVDPKCQTINTQEHNV